MTNFFQNFNQNRINSALKKFLLPRNKKLPLDMRIQINTCDLLKMVRLHLWEAKEIK